MIGLRVTGLDLSIVASGIALPSGATYTIKPHDKGDLRLCEIRDQLGYYLFNDKLRRPDLAVIEQIPTSRKGHNIAIILALVHSQARELLARHGVPFAYIDNKVLKKYATGSGGADKQAMVDAAVERGATVADGDQADAWWLRAAGLHKLTGIGPSVAHDLSAGLIYGPQSSVKWPTI